MMILRNKYYTNNMLNRLEADLDRLKINDYEISTKIPSDVISIFIENLQNITIYIPTDLEYSQYGIDDFIRKQDKLIRTKVEFDRNLFVMKLSGPITYSHLLKIIKYIIEENDFCTILDL